MVLSMTEDLSSWTDSQPGWRDLNLPQVPRQPLGQVDRVGWHQEPTGSRYRRPGVAWASWEGSDKQRRAAVGIPVG